jgi:hypothetical protein
VDTNQIYSMDLTRGDAMSEDVLSRAEEACEKLESKDESVDRHYWQAVAGDLLPQLLAEAKLWKAKAIEERAKYLAAEEASGWDFDVGVFNYDPKIKFAPGTTHSDGEIALMAEWWNESSSRRDELREQAARELEEEMSNERRYFGAGEESPN